VSISNVPTLTAGKQSDLRGDDIAGFNTRWVLPSTAVVTVCGELDASNVRQFTEYALGHIGCSKELLVDLKAVKFFSVSCFPVLHNLDLRCTRAGVGWALIPSAAVSRVLRIGDPRRRLPASPSVETALSTLRNRDAAGSLSPADAEAAADASFAV
jgi:anti-anti-sigma factor